MQKVSEPDWENFDPRNVDPTELFLGPQWNQNPRPVVNTLKENLGMGPNSHPLFQAEPHRGGSISWPFGNAEAARAQPNSLPKNQFPGLPSQPVESFRQNGLPDHDGPRHHTDRQGNPPGTVSAWSPADASSLNQPRSQPGSLPLQPPAPSSTPVQTRPAGPVPMPMPLNPFSAPQGGRHTDTIPQTTAGGAGQGAPYPTGEAGRETFPSSFGRLSMDYVDPHAPRENTRAKQSPPGFRYSERHGTYFGLSQIGQGPEYYDCQIDQEGRPGVDREGVLEKIRAGHITPAGQRYVERLRAALLADHHPDPDNIINGLPSPVLRLQDDQGGVSGNVDAFRYTPAGQRFVEHLRAALVEDHHPDPEKVIRRLSRAMSWLRDDQESHGGAEAVRRQPAPDPPAQSIRYGLHPRHQVWGPHGPVQAGPPPAPEDRYAALFGPVHAASGANQDATSSTGLGITGMHPVPGRHNHPEPATRTHDQRPQQTAGQTNDQRPQQTGFREFRDGPNQAWTQTYDHWFQKPPSNNAFSGPTAMLSGPTANGPAPENVQGAPNQSELGIFNPWFQGMQRNPGAFVLKLYLKQAMDALQLGPHGPSDGDAAGSAAVFGGSKAQASQEKSTQHPVGKTGSRVQAEPGAHNWNSYASPPQTGLGNAAASATGPSITPPWVVQETANYTASNNLPKGHTQGHQASPTASDQYGSETRRRLADPFSTPTQAGIPPIISFQPPDHAEAGAGQPNPALMFKSCAAGGRPLTIPGYPASSAALAAREATTVANPRKTRAKRTAAFVRKVAGSPLTHDHRDSVTIDQELLIELRVENMRRQAVADRERWADQRYAEEQQQRLRMTEPDQQAGPVEPKQPDQSKQQKQEEQPQLSPHPAPLSTIVEESSAGSSSANSRRNGKRAVVADRAGVPEISPQTKTLKDEGKQEVRQEDHQAGPRQDKDLNVEEHQQQQSQQLEQDGNSGEKQPDGQEQKQEQEEKKEEQQLPSKQPTVGDDASPSVTSQVSPMGGSAGVPPSAAKTSIGPAERTVERTL